MTLLLVVFQAHLIIGNILNGIFWFFCPQLWLLLMISLLMFVELHLVELNWLKFHQKTVEGFVGAWICTGIAAVIGSLILSKSDYLICPAQNLSTHLYNYPSCEPNPVFIPQVYQLPQNIIDLFGGNIELITFKPVYFHAAILATFASLIAPFGGFFCQWIKKSFRYKRFWWHDPGTRWYYW